MTTRRKPIAKTSIKNKKHIPKQNKTVKTHSPKNFKKSTTRTGSIKKGTKEFCKNLKNSLLSLTIFQKKLILTSMLLFLAHRVRLWPEAHWEQEGTAIFLLSIFLFSRTSPLHDLVKRRFGGTKLMMSLLIVFVIFPLGVFTSEKYKDWDNAQMIKGITKDFPVLSREIEEATGIELEHSVDCLRTQEKYGPGKRSCKMSMYTTEAGYRAADIYTATKNSSVFRRTRAFVNGDGYKVSYRSKNSCSFTTVATVHNSCVVGVRAANIQLAVDEFEKLKAALDAIE